jgi:glyoxylase-like metal-dependent hydrolase (beta-lactamase superfamily II)
MKKVKLFLNYAGYCIANQKHAIQGGANKNMQFNALFALILHPEKGWILFDTGYSERFFTVTRNFPNSIYAYLTKVTVSSQDEIQAQLNHFGICASDVKHVIISHFHADHIGGTKDFENAHFYCSRAGYKQMKAIPSFLGVTKGILKGLLPDDFDDRVMIIEDIATKKQDNIFGVKYDMWGDESIILYDLSGHAAGQIGMHAQTENNEYFFVSDACWCKESFEKNRPAHPIVRLFFHSWKAYISNLNKLNIFHNQFPHIIIVPTHCNETTSKLVSDKYDLDAL